MALASCLRLLPRLHALAEFPAAGRCVSNSPGRQRADTAPSSSASHASAEVRTTLYRVSELLEGLGDFVDFVDFISAALGRRDRRTPLADLLNFIDVFVGVACSGTCQQSPILNQLPRVRIKVAEISRCQCLSTCSVYMRIILLGRQ
jgi:hypothetical protein